MLLRPGTLLVPGRKRLTLPTSGGLAPGFPGFASGWTATRATLATGISPDPSGGSNAAQLTEDVTASATHFIATPTTITITANGTYTIEALIKQGSFGTRNLSLILSDNVANFFGATFNPSTGAFVANQTVGAGAVTTTGSASEPNSFWKVWVVGQVNGGATSVQMQANLTSGSATSYSGDGTSNVVLWGASVTAGSSPP